MININPKREKYIVVYGVIDVAKLCYNFTVEQTKMIFTYYII